jgi:NAD(P)-dependent dehydrogenase (short-subunit alcohol dehydrogenase family)
MARTEQPPLAGRVVVVVPGADEVALAVARDGAAVVIAGVDGEAAGALAAQVEAVGGRAAVFTGDLTRDADRAALAELLGELFD